MFITAKEKATLKADVAYLRKILKELQVDVNAMQANIMTLNLGRPVVLSSVGTDSPSITVTMPKKRGRPFGSKNKEKK